MSDQVRQSVSRCRECGGVLPLRDQRAGWTLCAWDHCELGAEARRVAPAHNEPRPALRKGLS